VFALGATLYHLLTGRIPFPGADHAEVVARKAEGAFTPASEWNHSVPPDLDGILARMLARDPPDRFATASDLVVALERSRLADKLPSFVDLELALQDPEARARLTTNGQATSPDLGGPAPQPVPAAAAERRRAGLRHWQMVLSTGFGIGLLAAASVAALCRLFLHL